ncbi:DNA repair -like protein 2, chloroplastic [Sesamum angolense]|uniref:DNA repair -like protein 2, chloroplastic n=1 Tax=Sesamum angolense TaxID=2727404 RepID=A0AAE1T734_9LAMI|nr:DNA repair -like protein 2, chloroplastic [Sesamum angolense]
MIRTRRGNIKGGQTSGVGRVAYAVAGGWISCLPSVWVKSEDELCQMKDAGFLAFPLNLNPIGSNLELESPVGMPTPWLELVLFTFRLAAKLYSRNDNIADPVAAAEEIAFCRACARFGLGLYLYHED